MTEMLTNDISMIPNKRVFFSYEVTILNYITFIRHKNQLNNFTNSSFYTVDIDRSNLLLEL